METTIRYILKDGKYKASCILDLSQIESGEYKKIIGNRKIIRRDRLLTTSGDDDIYENDPILIISSSDSGVRKIVTLAKEDNISLKSTNGPGGNAYRIVHSITKIDYIDQECRNLYLD